ncbi:MAG TPA: methylenetetrahydrofolate reductase C-terminal domain-containing protein, partial [Dissulfurispiraceae bacterium]|nr:methylenetetrahydrofolate reductase C-terminal domain-containing protein [Dissulfurispiraceae bacterium]
DEILDVLRPYERVGVIGCDGCAKACATGGSAQVGEMTEILKSHGKDIVFDVTPERTCYLNKSRDAISPHTEKLKSSEALLVLGCGGAVQIIRQLTEEDGITIPVKSGLDSVGHMDTIIFGDLAVEQCGECGQCVLNDTGGICPVTKCAKSLLNGPCGGAENGKCEVDRNRDCAWAAIYSRLKALGELDRLSKYVEPKDYSKAARPRTLYIKKGVVA